MVSFLMSLLRISGTLILAGQLTTAGWALERGAAPTPGQRYPVGSKISFQWDYSCQGGKACSFVCPDRAGASHVTALTIYLGTVPVGSQEVPAVFYYYSSTEIPRGSGFTVSTGLSSLSCQVNGMTIDYSGPGNAQPSEGVAGR
jgi:hypothetical protein